MITSTANKTVKEVIQLTQKAKARREQKEFVVEGFKMFAEAPSHLIKKVFIAESVEEEAKERYGDKLQHVDYEVVADAVFEKMSDTKTPQGVLCVVKQQPHSIDTIIKCENGRKPLLILLEDIQDPGNLGTIFRTGEGAGVCGIIMSKKTVDIYNPKTIRATMGSIYRMPFVYTEDLEGVIEKLKQEDIAVYAAHLNGKAYYDEYDYAKGTAFLIGNEGSGLKENTANLATSYLKIPMEGHVESLNAAVAASILMYEVQRQRRKLMK